MKNKKGEGVGLNCCLSTIFNDLFDLSLHQLFFYLLDVQHEVHERQSYNSK